MQIIIDNTIVHYEQYGNANKHIVILHGWGQSLNVWRNTALFLSQKYSVTIIDLPGFGSSEIPQSSWGTFEYTELVKNFLIKKNIHKPIIIGHSFGGRIATILAAHHPDLVRRIVLVDAGGIEIKSITIIIKIWLYKLFMKPVKKLFSDRLKQLLGSSDYQSASHALRPILAKVVTQDLRYLFPKIKTPISILWGSNDRVLPVRYTKIYKALIPQATVKILWGADHNPHITQPKQLLDTLDEILSL